MENVIDGLIMLKRFISSTMWEPIDDALSLLKEQDSLLKEYRNTIKDGYEALTNATKIIKSEPQIVRCKDCKHWEKSNGHCPFNSIFTNADWYCADGEMR